MGCFCGKLKDPKVFLVAHPRPDKLLVDGLEGQGHSQPFSVSPGWAASGMETPPPMLPMVEDSSGKTVLSVSGKCAPREDTVMIDGSGAAVAVLRTAQATAPTAAAGWSVTSWNIFGTKPYFDDQKPDSATTADGSALYLWGRLCRYPFKNAAKFFRVGSNGDVEAKEAFIVNVKLSVGGAGKYEAWSDHGGMLVMDSVKDPKTKKAMHVLYAAKGVDVALVYACTIAHLKLQDEIPANANH
eukprot:TRINITY_DN33606_c0_g1_i1.p1 TRINITY_DN33606_c0_g1~~TRINITY_DN33606_c0_g1_i1.p1  ORF type:complete len:265 (-),score=32.30 TRINITY_DN33606_c0_g1_i1:322-1047(-)